MNGRCNNAITLDDWMIGPIKAKASKKTIIILFRKSEQVKLSQIVKMERTVVTSKVVVVVVVVVVVSSSVE